MLLSLFVILAKLNPDNILPFIYSLCAAVQLKEMEKNTHGRSDWPFLHFTLYKHKGPLTTQKLHYVSLIHSSPFPVTISYFHLSPKISKTISPLWS